ncbi:hydroxyacylglutathione hydrolase [Pseudooceanicola lipolyticus]|uniref:Hydroxyacylglutathione hydrolase n=1 Tax=Pseudooceanicola lipolyticus TaxID=2029104 RepID=A0A2M8IZK8_9RHOB|nr:hydroxyacylglutathione hydrolase [Pseudooceanicola lipolyticus]PJE35934.1 hydroxyacylglutathione hydrolase [Pseudooceanicola lipolyticus]
MPLEIVTVPCLRDNYAFLGHDAESGATFLVDAPEAAPILAALAARGWSLSQVLITHHHADHVDGLAEILAQHDAEVIGAAADAARLPALDRQVNEGDVLEIAGEPAHVIDVSGHTVGHIAFHFPESHAVFTADSLMALGCGRVFEGSMEQMWGSLSKLAALPPETIVYSGHEYTQANGRFALTIEPGNPDLLARVDAIAKARAANNPTVPSALSLELATNPFLRAAEPSVQQNLGMEGAEPSVVFAEIRTRKDRF